MINEKTANNKLIGGPGGSWYLSRPFAIFNTKTITYCKKGASMNVCTTVRKHILKPIELTTHSTSEG